MVTSVPEGFAIFDDAAQNFIDRVGAMTDGQLTIDKNLRVRSLEPSKFLTP
jgi:TRAP-type mannitol/chloroaromatic compound transport system substrate-binding protein